MKDANKLSGERMVRRASKIIEGATADGRNSLLEYEAEELARLYKMPVVEGALAKTEKEALAVSKRIGFPVVMKIVSPDIVHKTDAGGVIVNIVSSSGSREAYRKILQSVKRVNRKADVRGIYVQKMAPKSHEFVVGATRDPQFGPTVMFGLGGIYVELFKDVSFRLAPVSREDALSMMRETKSSKILDGFRGEKPLDRQNAARVVQTIGQIMTDLPQVDSIDVNPLFIYPRGVLATDVRIILSFPHA